MMRRILTSLASLRLTVVLMSMSMVLIFVGTLAQVNLGVWQAVDDYFRSMVAWVDLQLFVPRQVGTVPWSVPIPGGMLLGLLLLVNLVAAHSIRFKMEKKRVGMIMLHAGIIVLLLGEFATGLFAEEGMMSIDEGTQTNYVEDIRTVEIAVIDPSDSNVDHVVSVPESIIKDAVRSRKAIKHPELPFEITVDRWIPNARLLRAQEPTPADQGIGTEAFPEELPRVRGVDGAQTDSPSAYVTLHREGERLGTWLLSADLIDAQAIEVDEHIYGIALRFKRTYKPYALHLIEFRHDRFVGTEIARNFSSQVRILDPDHATDREVLIRMNHPLRYRGATFYQASYKPDGTGTVLQVVRNPGAILPYIACGLVGIGMTLHFMIALVAFLRRQSKRETEARKTVAPPTHSDPVLKALPWALAVIGLAIAVSGLLRPPAPSEFDVQRFSTLPVSAGGRVKPMDTAARHVLLVAGGRQSIRHNGERIDAPDFLLELVANPESIRDLPIVRVDHPDVLALLGRTIEEGGRLPLSAIEPFWDEISEQADRALDIDSRRRDPFQREIVSLFSRVNTILAHSSMMAPHTVPPLRPGEEWMPFHDAFLESALARPPGHPVGGSDEVPVHPGVMYYIDMMSAYSEGDAQTFNQVVAEYDALLRQVMPRTMRRADHEVLFNRASLFTGAIMVYVLAFLVLCAALLLRSRSATGDGSSFPLAEGFRVSAVGLLWAAFIIHTLAIILRIYLQERPPVTNLYSSAVFVGWGAVLIGLLMERVHRFGIAALGAASIGFVTLIIAHHLGSDGDTMQMMQAVLDSNFWLATHVIIITIGYSAVFLAGALGIFFIMMGVFTRWLTKDRERVLAGMVYGVICFGLLLSFVGTVLGGIWADQSWGRFWGWDPKENGAALIVLICAIILHARWGGLIRARGIMVLAVGGNIITAWSWFGTNMLGIGLHSYGFMDSAVFWLILFVFSQLMIMAVGLVPLAGWRSYMHNAQPSGSAEKSSDRAE